MSWSKEKERFSIRLDKQYFNFAAAHFLIFPDGRRETLHGHNYRATIALDAMLGAGGMVVDFLVIKPLFRNECDALDHRTLLPLHNPWLKVREGEDEIETIYHNDRFVFPKQDVCLLPLKNTSSELLARHLADGFLLRLQRDFPELTLSRIEISVHESPGQAAVYERSF